MARTKQTARKSFVPEKIPRMLLMIKKMKGKGGMRNTQQSTINQVDSEQLQQDDDNFVNTQQFSLKFDDQDSCQKVAVQMELVACERCQAYCTAQSKVLSAEEYKIRAEEQSLTDTQRQLFKSGDSRMWICQFCLTHNIIPDKYEIPPQQNPCIILQKQISKKQEKQKDNGDKMLIFCIDISGSMDQVYQGKTRLQSVQEAIVDEVNRLHYQKEEIKIGLITFGSEVKLIGDGQAFKQQQLSPGLYNNFDGIVKELDKIKTFCYPLNKSYQSLKKIIPSLSVHGSTALGPGLLSAVQLASRGSVGSKVILCTDGEANVGLGNTLEGGYQKFYTEMAQYAKKKRVMVNILSIKGDKCNLKELGKLSLATGGAILKIDANKLGTEFGKIVKENVIGSASTLIVKLNQIFRICHGNAEELSKDRTTLTQDFGNFTQKTQLNFQFETIPKPEAEKQSQINMQLYQCKRVPMQIQLSYLGRNGYRYLQVVTDWRQLTTNIDDIYEGANYSLFAASVLQRVSLKIKNGQFQEAKRIIEGYWSIVKEKFEKLEDEKNLKKFGGRVKKLQKVLLSKMKKSNTNLKKNERTSSKIKKKRKQFISQQNDAQQCCDEQSDMASDSQNEIIYKEMRARERSMSRSRSRSREKSIDKNKQKDKIISTSKSTPKKIDKGGINSTSSRKTRQKLGGSGEKRRKINRNYK